VEKVTARYAPELALDAGSSFEPTFEAFTMPHVPPAHGEASSSLPSHVDPSVLDLRPPYDRQGFQQPQLSSNYHHNVIFKPNFSMGPQRFSHAQEVNLGGEAETVSQSIQNDNTEFQNRFLDVSYGPQPRVQGTMHSAPIPNTSANLSMDLSALQDMSWGQDHTSSHGSNVAGPSNLESHGSGTQYTTFADNYNPGSSFDCDLEPPSVDAILESELFAVSLRLKGDLSKAELADMRREMNQPSGNP
jgi:hypothetical protein